MDEDNFRIFVRGHTIEMEKGNLFIDDVTYENDPIDTTIYDLVRELFCWVVNKKDESTHEP
jgi:hypothetical protein